MKINCTEYLEASVLNFGSNTAVEDKNGVITFIELKQNASKIAIALINKSLGLTNQPIGVFLPKSKEAVTAFVAVNYSGNFYVPLDVKTPAERINKIIFKLQSNVIITNRTFLPFLEKTNFKGVILILEDILENQIKDSDFDRIYAVLNTKIDLDPIYSIFTSGSTGIPKGVLVSHRGVIDYIEWAKEEYNISDKEIIGSQAPFYFDNSTLDIYLMLATGAKLVIVPEEKYMFPVKLIEYINLKKINFVFWVPSVLINVANLKTLDSILPHTLKKILFAGEAMPNKHLNYWRDRMPKALYSNLYGPTEITVDCSFYTVDRDFKDDDLLPIGKACRNSNILVLNDKNELVKEQEKGELCVRGTSLALGYFADKEKTDEVFIQNPLNKNYPELIYRTGDVVYYNNLKELIFVGRKDAQIKHLGYRIELGEIESVVLGVNEVENCCVIYNNEQKQIHCFYIGNITTLLIRKQILGALPKYMIPTKWHQLEVFPENSNGKIDRKGLKLLF